MDELLKSRKLGSAASRRKKIQERETSVNQLKKRDLKVLLYGYGYCSDEEELSDDEDNHNTFSPVREGDSDRTTSVASPSSIDPSTPDELPSPPYVDAQQSWPDIETRVTEGGRSQQESLNINTNIQPDDARQLEVNAPESAKPLLHGTLNTRADFSFDLYSADFALSDPEDDPTATLVEPDTPVETATPVLYSQVRVRPSMISIKSPPSIGSRRPSAHHSISSIQPPPSPPRSSKRPSLISTHYSSPSSNSRLSIAPLTSSPLQNLVLPSSLDRQSSNPSGQSGYPACEAMPTNISSSTVPSENVESTMETTPEFLKGDFEPTGPSMHTQTPSVVVQRASKLRLSSLSSFKSYVKDARSAARESVQSRPTTAVAGTEAASNAFTAPRPSFSQHKTAHSAPPLVRPRTATASSTRSWGDCSVTALPALPSAPEPPLPSIPKSSTFEVARKKSFSALRSRSSSIGKALRSSSSSVVPTVSSFPPMPSINVSVMTGESYSRKASMDLSNFSLPPPSPLSPMSMASSFRSSKLSFNPGLGRFGRSRDDIRAEL